MKVINSPRRVDIEITSKCNQRCKYCNHFSSAGDIDDELTTEEWLVFFQELGRNSVMKVCLQGGEPLLRPDFKELVEGIVKNNMRFDLLSNCGLLDRETALFLHNTGRCDGVQLSIDGSTAKTHDSLRGRGTFDKTVVAIKMLQEHQVPVSVRVTLHKLNNKELPQIAHFLLEELKLKFFSINSVSYMGLCREYAGEIQLDVDDRLYAMETLLSLKRKYNGRISATSGPLFDAVQFLRMEQARLKNSAPFPNCGYLSACGCVFYFMGVRADGIMVPCILLPHIELGRINHDSLSQIWQEHPELNRLRERRSIPLMEIESCRSCGYINYCTGNCPALAYNLLGNDRHPNPAACLKQFLEAGGRLPNAQILVENN